LGLVLVKVLVTGASGFIAGYCISELVEHGYEVRGTVRDPGKAAAAGRAEIAELVPANLDADDGWAEAVAGCDYVLHVASPFPLEDPADENELIQPAVQGTLRVLRACAESGTVKRVVLTSSVAAVNAGHPGTAGSRVLTEEDWSDLDASDAYQKSKTLAERAAWDFVAGDRRFELAVVNPGMVLGPVRDGVTSTSHEPVRRLLARDLPGVPKLGFSTVDVRDLAVAHRLAMELPEAAGQRYICAGEHLWMRDMAAILSAKYRVPTRPVPYWALWVLGRFDGEIRSLLPLIGKREMVSADKARRELGWEMRPVSESLFDTAASITDEESGSKGLTTQAV
jgi:dihydroflavonol-4-reductase